MAIGFSIPRPVVAKVVLNGSAVEKTPGYYSIQRKDQTENVVYKELLL